MPTLKLPTVQVLSVCQALVFSFHESKSQKYHLLFPGPWPGSLRKGLEGQPKVRFAFVFLGQGMRPRADALSAEILGQQDAAAPATPRNLEHSCELFFSPCYPYGCGSKPMVPFWGRCTTHLSLF